MRPRILVVDDEIEITEMIQRNLNMEGYETDTVNDPHTALEEVRNNQYKIVISDIKMPSLSGVDLLKKIKSVDGIIQVIMITGYVKPSYLISSLSRGATDCLFKPLNMDCLLDSLERTVDKLQRWNRVLKQNSDLKIT